MHSLGNSSKWPSYDSLPSSSSFLLSESDLTEDEADVFSSEGEGESGGSKSFSSGGEGEGVPRLHLAFIVGSSQECCPHTPVYPPHCHTPTYPPMGLHMPTYPPLDLHMPTYPPLLGAVGGASTRETAATQGDRTFSQKCTELQRFIRPLLELLNGLKTGRFEKGLSSFQQSVAMDRLQRIVGILQKPDMGEKYLRTLLQVEVMLKVWFPQLTKDSLAPAGQNLAPRLPPRWHQAQLHIPVKKRKLSWSDSDFPSADPPHCKHPQRGPRPEESHPAETEPASPGETHRTDPEPASPGETHRTDPEPASPGERYWADPESASPERQLSRCAEEPLPRGGSVTEESRGRAWALEAADSKTRSSYTCGRGGKGKRKLQVTPPSPCGSPATQDSSVSSTIVLAAADSLQRPLLVADSLQCPLVAAADSLQCPLVVPDLLQHPLSGQQPLRCSSVGGPMVTSPEVWGQSLS